MRKALLGRLEIVLISWTSPPVGALDQAAKSSLQCAPEAAVPLARVV